MNYRDKELTKIFEYMQFGLPIIASNFPTWQNIIQKAECGFCVDPENPLAIADAINQLRDDPELWERMSQNGIAAAKNFTWQSQSAKLLKLYQRMLPRRRDPVTVPGKAPVQSGG